MRSSSVEPLPVPSAVRAARQPRFGLLFRGVALLGEALHWLVASALLRYLVHWRVSEALCMRFNPQSRRRVRNNDCCVPEEA